MKCSLASLACVLVFGWANGEYFARKHALRSLGVPEGKDVEVPPDQWFHQKLDHFDPTNPRTWWQRYHTNEEWFGKSRNSPVFLRIGGENETHGEWMVTGAWTDYARTYGALCFQLEHRFYGKSQPTGDLSVSSLQYLSSEQALADIAYFIDDMNKKYQLSTTNKWVVFGASYPGSLAAWARLKYPHLVHAAVSSSAAVLAQLDFKGYNEVVRQALEASSPQCARDVHKAALEVEDALKKPSTAKTLSDKFKVCRKLDLKDKGDLAMFVDLLALSIKLIIQDRRPARPTIEDLCNTMKNASIGSLVDRYAAVHNLVNHGECMNVSYFYSVEKLRKETTPRDPRAWYYQSCTEFGLHSTSSSGKEFFGAGPNLEFFINLCRAVFGNDFGESRNVEGIKRTNLMYGGMDIVNHVTNVIFVHGSLDPWHVLGVTNSTNPKAPVVLIQGAGHCADTYSPSSKDPPELAGARKKIEEFIGEFLSIKPIQKTEKPQLNRKKKTEKQENGTTSNKNKKTTEKSKKTKNKKNKEKKEKNKKSKKKTNKNNKTSKKKNKKDKKKKNKNKKNKK